MTKKVSDLVYLDYNCFQRGFDDHRQVRNRMEAVACEAIFAKAEEGSIQLVWSFMHDDECAFCPFPERKLEGVGLSALCGVRVGPTEDIRRMALVFEQQKGLSAKDAVHLACARASGANVLVSCDDEFLKLALPAAPQLKVLNPVDYVRSKEGEW